MLGAIFFLLLVVTLLAIMVSMTAQTSKRGTDIYFQEQAHLLAKSATEYALLAISGHERNSTTQCINAINIRHLPDGAGNSVYEVNTTIRYIGLSSLGGTCAGNNSLINNIVTPESNGTILVDVYVSIPTRETGMEPVRFHRRTMQKP